MKWKKLGRIFNPSDFLFTNDFGEFAQSPQALVFDDFVRIYFSTRHRDVLGKYISTISFVDFDKEFKRIINISKESVIPLGGLGCFDEHGIFPINIVRQKNSAKIFAYTTGWNRKVSVSVDASIGFAVSNDDGLTFKKMVTGLLLHPHYMSPF
jgi:hypothetical protein